MLGSDASDTGHATEGRCVRIHALVVKLLGDMMRAPLEEIDCVIDNTLSCLGQFCDVDRAYVFRRNVNDGGEIIDNTHEWCAPGMESAIHQNRNLSAEMIAHWRQRFEADEPVDIHDVDALPDASPEKTYMQSQGICSLLALPMQRGGQLAGFVGFDSVRANRVFPAGEVQLLKSVADAVGNMLERVDAAAEIARTRDSLASARNRLQATLDAVPDLILEVDADGRYCNIHTADTGQLGVPPEALVGRTHEEAMPPGIAALNRRAMAEAKENGRSGPHPFDIDTPRGRRRYNLVVVPRPTDRPDEAPGFVFIARDVTDEWRLRSESERLSLLGQHMTNLVIVADTEQRIEWVNPAFEARTGWRLEEVRGKNPRDISRGDSTNPEAAARIDAALAEQRPVRDEILNYTRDGTAYWVDVQLHPLHDALGQHTGFVSIESDITERKRQDAELERLAREANEARARLEMAVEALPEAFAYYDAEDRLVLCNARYRAVYPNAGRLMVPGTRFEDILRAGLEHREVPDAIGREEEWLARRLEQHANPGPADERHLQNGRWLRVVERRTPDGGCVGMRTDITELKRAEQRLADIIHGAEVGTWEWTLSSGDNHINARWAEIVGYTLDELSPLTIDVWKWLVHPDDMIIAEQRLGQVFARKVDQFEYELRMRHKAGHWVWVMSRGRVSRWRPDGSPEVMAGVHIDITALKRAEERLGEIIDAAAAGTWELDVLREENRVNDRWAEMLGYTSEELAALPLSGFRELAHPDDMARLQTQHDRMLHHGGESFANEIRMRHREGHWVWLLSRGRVVARDSAGKPVKIAGIHLDITERKRLESQLVAERDYLARLMDTSASGIAAMDCHGRIIFANREAERILGLSASAMVERHYDSSEWQITSLQGGPFASADLPFMRALSEERTVRDVRFALTRPDGSRRMLSVNAAPIDVEGLEVRVVVSINDITEQVAAENDLRAAAERAEAANRAKSRFLANMSHEIRTPLNGVLGMTQMLEDELSEPRYRRMLHIIRDSGEMLLGVLDDVLDMSKIEAGKLALEDVMFAPTELASRIEGLHKIAATNKGLKFDLRLGPGARPLRRGDPNRISQVLHNLVGNAVKFTETGCVTVSLNALPDGGLEILVCDTGIGMTAEQLARVFEDFEQADGTVTRRFGGTGLGMSIVRRLVGLMGGTITVHSTPCVGTQARVCLPLPLVDDVPPLTPVEASHSLAGLRVLAADDNATNLLILKSMLSRLEVEAVLVKDGRAAVDTWAPGRFDVLLLDISMPELDGVSALAEIRAAEAKAGVVPTPALAISANAMTHQVAEYLNAGFAAHVGKPFRRADLADALTFVLTAKV